MASLRSISWSVLFIAAAFTFTGCTGDTSTGDTSTGESGSLNVNLELEGDVTINEVEWVLTGNGMEPMTGTINTSAPGATPSVEVFGILPGEDYLITMTATSADGETSCGGSAEFDVEVGVSTNVMVMLNCKPPQDLGGVRVNGDFNICADLVKVVVSPLQTSVGNDIDLAAAGDDYEGDAFEYLWEATGGSIADPSAASTVYTCEEVGNHEVRVTLSDDDFNYCMCDWTVAITCVDAELCDGIMCDDGEVCIDEVCVPVGECIEDDDCGDGEVCRDFECVDLCADVECDDENECTAEACSPQTGECEGDPVDNGTACDDDAGMCVDGECVTNPDCVENEDCDQGEICIAGECVLDVECIQDTDCVELNQCKMAVCDAGVCSSADLEDGTSCELPDIDDAECRMGECEPVNVTLGDDFALVFQQNLNIPTLHLFLSGPVATSGEVSIGETFSEPFTVTPGEVTTVNLPSGSEITTHDVIEVNAAVRITSEAPITVYGLNRQTATTDAFAGLPAPSLGQRYRVMSWPALPFGTSQLAIAAVAGPDNDPNASTSVTITPSATAGSRPAGVPYTIEMNPFDAYQLQSSGDLTGTLIESSRPIAVFGSNKCANIPDANYTFCDHLVEQMPPVSTWGREALTVPLATRVGGDTFRIVADQDGTAVELEGAAPESFMLNAGEFAERLLDGSYRISSDAPILVAQYSNSTSFDGVTSDPFMMLIPSSEQFLDSYTFATPASGFPDNYANIVALTTDAMAGDVLLDGVPVPAAEFSVLAGTDFSATQAVISLGTHTVSAPSPAGLYVYGFATADSYGYPGGFSAGAQ
jgi:hypothetical protein